MDTTVPTPMPSRYRPRRIAVLLCLLAMALLLQSCDTRERSAVADCNGITRDIVFAGLDWDSAQLQNHIAGTILQAGFGCDYTDIPGGTIAMAEALAQGDVDITMEVWVETAPPVFDAAVAAGQVLDLGLNMRGVEHAFLVPRYVIEGDPDRGITALAPHLASVDDLARHAQVFQDPQQPDKGRYHNCIVGWVCEGLNTQKLATYGLAAHFNNFRPDDADALAGSLAEAYAGGEPWLGYYWGPTPVLGSFDLVALAEPAYSDACWVEGDYGCAFPPSVIHVAVSKGFADAASAAMIAFLRAYGLDQQVVSDLLAYMADHDASAADAARYFLETRAAVWSAWVSEDVAARVRAALN